MLLVSIVCLTYNHAPYIRQCLDGFLMQKCDFDFEVLIHDDASTDGTSDIIREYAKNYPHIVKPIFQTENQFTKGLQGVNMRFKFPRAKGKYIAMCEGDDYWTNPLKLKIQVDYLEENSDHVLSFHNVKVVDKSDKIIVNDRLTVNDDVSYPGEAMNTVFMPTLSLVFRNHIIDYKNFPKVFNGDAYLLGLLSPHGKARYHGFFGANYRMHTGGIYSGSSIIKNHLKSIETRKKLLQNIPAIMHRSVRQRSNYFYICLLVEYWQLRKLKAFTKTYFQMFSNLLKIGDLRLFFSSHKSVFIRLKNSSSSYDKFRIH